MIFNNETFRNHFLFLPAYSLIIYVMRSPVNFEKIAILKIWQLVTFIGGKTHFGKTVLKLCIFMHEKYCCLPIKLSNSYHSYKMWSVWYLDDILIIFETIAYPKDNFYFQESIFQWQIKPISNRSEFWHLRRKSAVIFSKWLLFQDSFLISWAT